MIIFAKAEKKRIMHHMKKKKILSNIEDTNMYIIKTLLFCLQLPLQAEYMTDGC